MKDWFTNLCLALIAGSLLLLVGQNPRTWTPPAPAPAVSPEPPKRKPLLPVREEGDGPADSVGAAPNAPDGTEPEIDFPDAQWMKNIGSRLDGAGMCVFTSFEHSMRWAGLEEFRGFRDWCAQKYPGGGYPEKLAKLVKAYCSAKNISREVFDPDKDMVQIDASSAQAVELIEAALRQNLLPCVTLYYSPKRYGGRIYHMINCAHLDGKQGAELDNNFRPLEWSNRAECIRRMSLNNRLWAVCVNKPGPPRLPHH